LRRITEQLGEVIRRHAGVAKDPLLDVVGLLELNCRNVKNVLQKARHVLPRLFVGLFPKKRKEMPTGNLRQLVDAFDTLKDPMLQLKLSSMKRCVKGMVSLALSHGKDVNWEKVRSSHARCPKEMKEFFSEAKKYAPNLVSLILPTPTPATTAPSSSTPLAPDSTPSEVS
jgi:hypothetical protein